MSKGYPEGDTAELGKAVEKVFDGRAECSGKCLWRKEKVRNGRFLLAFGKLLLWPGVTGIFCLCLSRHSILGQTSNLGFSK